MQSSVLSYENALKSLVPDILLRKLRRRVGAKIEVESKITRGACLLADISGFTKLSGELCASGIHGLDDLRQATSDFLAKFIHIVHAFQGDVISFAGDALVCIFWPREGASVSEDYRLCRRATECGFILKDHCTDNFTAHIAISYGDVCFSFLGGYMNDWVYVVNGTCITELSSCITDASQRELVITSECFDVMNKTGGCFDITSKQLPSSNVRIERMQRLNNITISNLASILRAAYEAVDQQLSSELASTSDCSEEELDYQDHCSEEIRPLSKIFWREDAEGAILKSSSHILKFLPRPVVATLSAGYFHPISELRTVTTAFLKLDSFSIEKHRNAHKLQDFFYAAQVALFNAGGCLRQFLVDDKGCVLIALWGVPSASFGNNATRALRFSHEIRHSSRELDHACSIGITTGSAFCGTIGSSARQDYAAIGNKVNLAARLMMKAQGRILIDDVTLSALPSDIRTYVNEIEPLQLKGSTAPVTAFAADNVTNSVLYSSSVDKGNSIHSALEPSDASPSSDEILVSSSSDAMDGGADEMDDFCQRIVGSTRNGVRTLQTNLSKDVTDQLEAAMNRLLNFEYSHDLTGGSASEKRRTSINTEDSSGMGLAAVSDSRSENDMRHPLMQFIVVEGGGGMGKSEVCRYFRRMSLNNKIRTIAMRARYVDEKIEYGVARRLFEEIVGADLQTCAGRKDMALQLLRRAYPDMSDTDIIMLKFPVLKTALGLKWHLSVRNNPYTTRKDALPFDISKTMSWKYAAGLVLVDILGRLLVDDPITIIVDDAHYCDKLTWNLLNLLSTNIRFPVVALISVRKSSLSELFGPEMVLSPSTSMTLGGAAAQPSKQSLGMEFSIGSSGPISVSSRMERTFKSRGFRIEKTPVMVAVDSLLLHSSHSNQHYSNVKIELSPLSVEQLRSLLTTTWGNTIEITEDLMDILCEATSMIPFWCKCFAEFAREYGADSLRASSISNMLSGMPIARTPFLLSTPTNRGSFENYHRQHSTQQTSSCLTSILANMMDKLSVTEQMVLKMGSVVGVRFSSRLLRCLLPEDVRAKMKVALHALQSRRFIEHIPSMKERIYSFQNVTIRDMVYKFILPSDAAKLHSKVAAEIEKGYAQDLKPYYDLLLYHYVQATPIQKSSHFNHPRRIAQLKRKTFGVALRAASDAVASGAISQAIEYINLAASAALQTDHILELLAIVESAVNGVKQHDSIQGGENTLDFTYWDAGDDELLEVKEKLQAALFRLQKGKKGTEI